MSKKQSGAQTPELSRDTVIIRTSIIGILANVLLAAFKAAVGIASNSIAVVLDAVNNLSDALSSIITIIGTKLAGKLPDKKHPLGYGRIEYLSAMIVSGIVLYAGITSAVESVKKIIHPEKPDYSVVSLVIIAVAVAVKIVLGRYVKAKGEEVNSGSLIASGSDAMFDAMSVREVDRLTRKLERKVYRETGIVLVAVGVYSYNTEDNEAGRIQKDVYERVMAHDWAVQVHGFYVDVEAKEMTFDVVLSFDMQPKEALAILYEEMQKAYPDYKISIAPDVDVSVTQL